MSSSIVRLGNEYLKQQQNQAKINKKNGTILLSNKSNVKHQFLVCFNEKERKEGKLVLIAYHPVNSGLADTPLLWTLIIMDKIQIPSESY